MTFHKENLLKDPNFAQEIITKIRQAILLNEERNLQSQPVGDLKLFTILQGAISLMYRLSPDEFGKARRYLETLIEMMPSSPEPLAWMARWHALRAVQGWSLNPQKEAQIALSLTSRALDIDPNHALSLVCEGQVLAHLALELNKAHDRYSRALQEKPGDPFALALSGMLATFRDQYDDGLRQTERALHLTPHDPDRFFYLTLAAGANFGAGNYERAVDLAKESLRLNRSHASALRTLAVAQQASGHEDKALETAKMLLKVQPEFNINDWLRSSPAANFDLGTKFAEQMHSISILK